MTTISYARLSACPVRCWLCGTDQGPSRSDVHLAGHLCPSCWIAQPRGYNRWVRAASALAIRLELDRRWTTTGLRQVWLQDAADRQGIRAWHDTPTGASDPDKPFGWLTLTAVDQAAAELEQREAEFHRSCIAPGQQASVRRPGGRGR